MVGLNFESLSGTIRTLSRFVRPLGVSPLDLSGAVGLNTVLSSARANKERAIAF